MPAISGQGCGMQRLSSILLCGLVLAAPAVRAQQAHAGRGVPMEGETGPPLALVAVEDGSMHHPEPEYWDQFGGLSLAAWGDTVVAAAPTANDHGDWSGVVFSFVRNESGWVLEDEFVPATIGPKQHLGQTLAIHADTAVVSSAIFNQKTKRVHVFDRVGGRWVESAMLTGAACCDDFGWDVALDGDTLAIGAPAAEQIHVHVREDGVWNEQAIIPAPVTGEGSRFGSVLALHGDSLAAYANWHGPGGTLFGAGEVYVFRREGGAWSLAERLHAAEPAAGESFGSALALHGDTLAVGVPIDEAAGEQAGSVQVYVREGEGWAWQASLTAFDHGNHRLGTSVGLWGDVVLAGAPQWDLAPFNNTGAAYVFARNGTTWTQQTRIARGHPGNNDQFGRTAALTERHAIIGILNDDIPIWQGGSVAAYALRAVHPWAGLGGGTAGAFGVPHLVLGGSLAPESSITLSLDAAPPSAFALLLTSASSAPAPFLGGTLHAHPIAAAIPLVLDDAGSLHAQLPFAGAPSGTAVFVQAAVQDASVPWYGASLSHGVAGLVP